jgi:VCBS repeat-containing protein
MESKPTFDPTKPVALPAAEPEIFMEPSKRAQPGPVSKNVLRLLFFLAIAAAGSAQAAPPAISGLTTNYSTSDKVSTAVFSGINLTAANPVTNTISFTDSHGSFPTNTLTKTVTGGIATYTLDGRQPTPAANFLDSVLFAPTENRVSVGQTDATIFTLTASDSNGSTSTNVTLNALSVDDPPVVSFGSNPSGIDDTNTTSKPFASISITDPDTNDTVTVKISFPDSHGTLSSGTKTVSGDIATYSFSIAQSPSSAQTTISNLVYTPVPNRIPLGETETTTFTVIATDQSTQSDTNSVDLVVSPVNDRPRITGSVVTALGDNQTVKLFAAISITDPDVVRIGGVVTNQHVMVTVSNSITPGSVAVYGSYQNETNPFTLSDTPALVTSTLDNVLFVPLPNLIPVGQTTTFTVTLTVTDLSSTDSPMLSSPDNSTTTVVITSINDVPTLTVTDSPSTILDNQTAKPFHLTISDPDVGETNFVIAITPLDGSAGGTISPPGPFTGDASSIAFAVQSIQFTPAINRVTNAQPIHFLFSVTNHSDIVLVTNQIIVQEVNDLPEISVPSVIPIQIHDDQTATPFSNVTISDVDRGGAQPVNVTISLDDPNKGSLTPAGPFGPTTNITPAAATAAIRAVVFTPTANRIPVGQTETTTFTITVTDILGGRRSNSQVSVVVQSVNGAPQILGVPLIQPLPIAPASTVKPFAEHEPFTPGITISDDDTNITVTVSLDDPTKGVLSNLGGFVQTTAGVYQIATNPAAATLALTNLDFQPSSTFPFPPGSPGGTTFTIQAQDELLNTTTKTLSIVLNEAPRNWLVTRIDDDLNAGSLRFAVSNAANQDVITFALTNYPALIRLSTNLGPIVLNQHVTLRGPGADLLTISGDSDGNGSPDTQLFRIHATVTIEGVTLTQGLGQTADDGGITGGAIYVGQNGALTLLYCAVTDSQAAQWGGGIDIDQGSLVMSHCFVGGNSTSSSLGLGGGAISLFTDQACSFSNTTFSANTQGSSTGYGGGALYVENAIPSTDFPVVITHCTFAENSDTAGKGSSISANVFGTMVSVHNSIFADGTGRNLQVEGSGLIQSTDGNISDDSTSVVLTQNGQPQSVILFNQHNDHTNTDAQLLQLDSHVRPTPGYPLASSSPAIGLAVAPAEITDQRGVLRDLDPDSGALEFNAFGHLALNEIHFDPNTGESDFVELYVTRDSTPLNLKGYQLLVDGTNRFVFTNDTLVEPGHGVVIADTNITAGDVNFVTPVFSNILGGHLNLQVRGRVDLLNSNNAPVISETYVGQFVDPFQLANTTEFAHNSITLAPQFLGEAYVPHKIALPPPRGGADLAHVGATSSPGRDTGNTAFGSPNALPFAVPDTILVTEDDLTTLNVLNNDLDADRLDQLVIVNLSTASNPNGNSATASSTGGAAVAINPSAAPLRGTTITYDPRYTSTLQSLPEGARRTDTFYYTIVDIGAGPIVDYQSTSNGAATLVVSPAHRLTNGEPIIISGSDTTSYNKQYSGASGITRVDDDSFSIPVAFLNDPVNKGSWVTVGTRQPTTRSETTVTVTVLGVNDPPTPAPDTVATDEETILRIMGDPDFAGSTTAMFDTDQLYPMPRVISPVNLLSNDTDPDTDDDKTTLKVIGVVGSVTPITGFSGTPGASPVVVTSTNHHLLDGTQILISGYHGHPSYNGYHSISLIDSNTFSIPIQFVDNNLTNPPVWTILNDANRLSATSQLGAAVALEIRADRKKTCVVYNPRVSAYLDGIAKGETNSDSFYYAVQDSHAAITLAQVTVKVAGVDEAPVANPDPGSLGLLSPLVQNGLTLSNVISQLQVLYHLPPGSGTSNRVDTQVLFSNSTTVASLFLTNLWVTDEKTKINISATNLLANDTDVDRTDVLSVNSIAPHSREGATNTLSPDHLTITYDPSVSSSLDALARGEQRIDTFDVVVSDGKGGLATNLVAVLVIGVNDTPIARPDTATTDEDTAITFDPTLNDIDVDINGVPPDNRLVLLPVTNLVTARGALVSIVGNSLTYDPTKSVFLDGLGPGQSTNDTFSYTVMDGSFVFANNDFFKVVADGSGFTLDLLANDRTYTGLGGTLQITSVGTPNNGGSVVINNGANVTYTPQVNFVGDEVFTYTISDQMGDTDSGLVTVRVTVDQLNGNLQANNDSFSVAKGQTVFLDVLANDNVIPADPSSLTITRVVAQPNQGGTAFVVNNQIQFTPASVANSYPYTETFSYEISGGGSSRATAVVTVTVINRDNTLNVRNDAFSVQAGSFNNLLDVLFNDNILPGSTAALTISQVTPGPSFNGQVDRDPSSKALIYSPNPGFVGIDTLTYVATDGLGGTGTGSVTITVGSLLANNDFFVVPLTNATIELDVLANDLILQGTFGTNISITKVSPTSSPVGTMGINGSGTKLLFGPGTATGDQQFVYTIADGFGRSVVGNVTLTVLSQGIKASADAFTVQTGSSGNVLDVLANDATIPKQGRTLTIVSIGTGTEAPNQGGTVTINDTNDRLIYTPAPGFIGEETFSYTMTDSRQTDTARVAVKVSAGDLAANQDVFSVFLETESDGTLRQFTLPVLDNDRALPDLGQTLTITTVGFDPVKAPNAPVQSGKISISQDGLSLIYQPADTNGPFPYVERFDYEISDGTTRRAAAIAIIEVQKRINARALETKDDAYSVATASQNNILTVLANDGTQPGDATGWAITSVSAAAFNGVVVINGPSLFYTPQPNFVGTDHFTYTVSDGLGGTGTANVSVKVGDLPVCDDAFTVISGTTSNVLDVLANDAIRPATPTNYLLLDTFGANQLGTVSVSAGVVLYTPNAAATSYPYTETFSYRVQDNSLGTVTGKVAVTVFKAGSDRATTNITVTVNGVNDPPVITNTVAGQNTDDKTPIQAFKTVTISDVDVLANQLLTVTIRFDNSLKGILTNLGGFVNTSPGVYTYANASQANVTAAIDGLWFVPTQNRIPVPTSEITSFTITASDGIAMVTNTAVTVNVLSINDPPVITGTVGNQPVYDHLSMFPFAGVTITEVDNLSLQPLSLSVTIAQTNLGFLTALGPFILASNGVYTVTNITGALATTALRGLIYIPTPDGRLSPGQSETNRLTIAVNDGFTPPVVNGNTTVISKDAFIKKVGTLDGSTKDTFAYSVSANRDLVVVGNPNDTNTTSVKTGSASLLSRTNSGPESWSVLKRVIGSDSVAGDTFGAAVGLSADTFVVGAPTASQGGKATGVAYVFTNAFTTNVNQAIKLVPSDGSAGDQFGQAVAISVDTIIVGAYLNTSVGTNKAGAAYVFGRNQGGANKWGLVKKLFPTDGGNNDDYGISVGINADTIVIGSHANSPGNNSSKPGAAYTYDRNIGGANNWGFTKKLTASDGLSNDQFGHAVGVSSNLIIVGANNVVINGSHSGRIYLFDRNLGGTNNWGQTNSFLPFDGSTGNLFGNSVAIDGELFAAGTLLDLAKSGAVYVYARSWPGLTNWSPVEKLVPATNDTYAAFGFAVSLGQYTLATGAHLDNTNGSRFSETYIYRLRFDNGPAVATPIPDQIVAASSQFNFPIPPGTFADADANDPFTYALVTGPGWLSLSNATLIGQVPGIASTNLVTIRATDTDGGSVTTSFNIIVKVGPVVTVNVLHLSPLETWRSIYFPAEWLDPSMEADIWGDNADPDGDGVSNLLEYVFGTDPQSADSGDSAHLSISTSNTGSMLLSYKRRTDDSRLSYSLEAADQSTGWQLMPSSWIIRESVAPLNNGVEQVTEELYQANWPAHPLFFRVHVSIQ